MKNVQNDIKMVIFLLTFTTICAVFLAGANTLYQKGLAIREKQLRMDILKQFDVSFSEEEFESSFEQNVEITRIKETACYYKKGTPKLATVVISGPGLWSIIELLMMVNLESKTMIKLEVLAQAETPGLGARITEDSFLRNFEDLDYSKGIKILMEKKGEAGEVNGITGATKTTQQVEKIINKGLKLVTR